MPGTEQGVRFKAKKNLWPKRTKDRGKGEEYYFYGLPRITQSYLVQTGQFVAANCAEPIQAGMPLPATIWPC